MTDGVSVAECVSCGAKNRVNENLARRSQAVCGRCGAVLDAVAGNVGDASSVSKPVKLTDATFEREVLNAADARPVLVDMWAEWCGPCRMIAPALDELAAESGGRYRVAKLNVDDNPRTAARFQVRSIPLLLIFKRGQLVDQLLGAQPKQAIAARLNAHV